jgi:predicted CopG family antitoxin
VASQSGLTTITVPVFVRQALAKYKTRGKSYGDVILEFIEEYPTAEFLKEMDRRFREEPRISLAELRKRRAY